MVILDELTGKGQFFVERMFHFAPGVLGKTQDQWTWKANGRHWCMVNTSTTELQDEIVVGRETPPLGWYSEYRGKRVESPTVRQYGTVIDVLRCATVMISDHSRQAKVTIDTHYPDLNANNPTLQFSIGYLMIKPFEDRCEFNWLINGWKTERSGKQA